MPAAAGADEGVLLVGVVARQGGIGLRVDGGLLDAARIVGRGRGHDARDQAAAAVGHPIGDRGRDELVAARGVQTLAAVLARDHDPPQPLGGG